MAHWPIEIVDLPIKNAGFPELCKRLPEGIPIVSPLYQCLVLKKNILSGYFLP